MREVPLPFLQAAFAQQTGEAALVLVTIDHASLTTPIRVCNDGVDLVSNGQTFVAYPFEIDLPTDVEEAAPRARLKIDNVDRQIMVAIRSASGAPPTVSMQVILASDPDTIIAEFPDFALRDATYNALTVEGDLTMDVLAAEPYPAGTFRPGAFPGLF